MKWLCMILLVFLTSQTIDSKKHLHGGSKITLIENDRFLSENHIISKTFKTYFESVTDSLNLFEWIGESVIVMIILNKLNSRIKAKRQSKQKILLPVCF